MERGEGRRWRRRKEGEGKEEGEGGRGGWKGISATGEVFLLCSLF